MIWGRGVVILRKSFVISGMMLMILYRIVVILGRNFVISGKSFVSLGRASASLGSFFCDAKTDVCGFGHDAGEFL